MRFSAAIQSVVLGVALVVCPLASQTQTGTAQDDLAKPFNWPLIVSSEAGVQFLLRTRWQDGVLAYVATLTDSKGRIAKWFLKHPDGGAVPLSSFQVTFADEEDFRLYTLYLHDRTFTRVAGTAHWEAKGESQCTEKIYRAALKAATAKGASDQSSHGLNYPSELDEPSPPPVKREVKK
jgi:hypothetical protein